MTPTHCGRRTAALLLATLALALAACSSNSSGSNPSSSGTGSTKPPVSGVTMPSSVSVVTATNAG